MNIQRECKVIGWDNIVGRDGIPITTLSLFNENNGEIIQIKNLMPCDPSTEYMELATAYQDKRPITLTIEFKGTFQE